MLLRGLNNIEQGDVKLVNKVNVRSLYIIDERLFSAGTLKLKKSGECPLIISLIIGSVSQKVRCDALFQWVLFMFLLEHVLQLPMWP